MSAEQRLEPNETRGGKRQAFREWRGQRPFWGGLLTILAGVPIMYLPYANLTIGSLTVRMATTAGAGSLIIGVLLVVLGLTMWFQPASRVFAGVAAILLALVSIVVSNFGGLVVGFLMGLIGGALSVSWAPGRPAQSEEGPGGPDRVVGPVIATNPAPAAGGPGLGNGLDNLSGTSPTNGTNGRHRAG
ncbi:MULTISPECIES: DUF6114 domain-containing protein [Streptomyces]|uniref:Integral membrane protein n=2 Tax=Streptomyces TaxID=1883 RepID=A0A2N8PCX8_STRNR|nr:MULTISPECIES: DUF6114 domain-containing protein [Streptomyces]PNE38888.1 hypothetical protein AOB60_33680 [Streptomyces noursei]SHL18225.1 hypothetical protein SAMN05216268_103102 [Streptomyces yunnanensis]